MDIFGVLTMAGGLALFLYGMETMGKGLSQISRSWSGFWSGFRPARYGRCFWAPR